MKEIQTPPVGDFEETQVNPNDGIIFENDHFEYIPPVEHASSQYKEAWEIEYRYWWKFRHRQMVAILGLTKIFFPLEKVLGAKFPLTEEMVNGILDHPFLDYAAYVSETRKLNPGQLARVFSHPRVSRMGVGDLNDHLLDQVFFAQERLGVSKPEIEGALVSAKKIIKARQPFYIT